MTEEDNQLVIEEDNQLASSKLTARLLHLSKWSSRWKRSSAKGLRTPWPRGLNCGTLHLPLVVYNHSCIVLKVDELSVLSSERLPLTDDHSRHHLFPQLWLSLLHGGQNHVSAAPSGQS